MHQQILHWVCLFARKGVLCTHVGRSVQSTFENIIAQSVCHVLHVDYIDTFLALSVHNTPEFTASISN